MVVTLTLPYDGCISVNRYLGRTRSGGSYIRPEASMWGLILRYAIRRTIPVEELKLGNPPFNLDVHVGFPRKFSKRSGDPTNFDKYPRDIISSELGVDDAGTSGTQTGEYGLGDQSFIRFTITLNDSSDDSERWSFYE